jgi:hypothetical protein
LFIEFVVTHQSSPEKLASGMPIIEVAIQGEDDAVECGRGGFDDSSPHVKVFNFRPPVPADLCKGDCFTLVDVFFVHSGGKCVVAEVALGKIGLPDFYPWAPRKLILGRSSNQRRDEGGKVFRQLVRKAHFEGLPVRNCFVCDQHGIGIGIVNHPIFCKEFSTPCKSNAAADCPKFRPFRTPADCEAAEEANLATLRGGRNSAGRMGGPKPSKPEAPGVPNYRSTAGEGVRPA